LVEVERCGLGVEFGIRIFEWTDCVDVGSHYKPCDVFRKEF